jgi:hypothetical protein
MIDDRYFSTDGTPDPRACHADSECLVDTVVDSGGCCVANAAVAPQAWAWHTWISERRMSGACADARCPPLPAPMPPSPDDCHMQARCIESRCADACP